MENHDKIRELIAVGASITANCQQSLTLHLGKALASGASREEVSAAMEIGHRVRKAAADKLEIFSAGLQSGAAQGFEVVTEGNGFQYLGP